MRSASSAAADPHHREEGAEGLLAHDGHLQRRVGDQGGWEELPAPQIGPARAAGQDTGAARDGVGDLPLGARDLRTEGDGADVDGHLVGAVAPGGRLAQAGDLRGHELQQPVGGRRLDQHALGADADLAAAGEPAPDGGAGGARQIGVGEHDHRRLPPQLQHRRE